MTKDEAAAAITKAIAAQGMLTGTLSIDAFAVRLAAGLEALGLLDYCYEDAGRLKPANEIDPSAAERYGIAPPVPGNPLGRTGFQQPDIGQPQPSRDQLEGSTDVPPLDEEARANPQNIPPYTDVPPLVTEGVLPDGTTASGNPAWASQRQRDR